MPRYLEEAEKLFDDYERQVIQLEANRKLGDGLLGFGKRVEDAPCHGDFDRAMEALISQIARDDEAAGDAAIVAELLLRAEDSRVWPASARWMALAVQRHALLLIPLLSSQAARQLGEWYEKRYPARIRFPVQKEILKALKKADHGK